MKINLIDDKQVYPQYSQQGIPISPEYKNPVQGVYLQPYQQQNINGYPQPQAFVVQNNQVPISTIPVQNGQVQYVQGQYTSIQPGVPISSQPIPVATMAPPRFENMYIYYTIYS